MGHDQSDLSRGVGGPQDPDVLYTPDEIVGELPGLNIWRAETALRPVNGSPVPARDIVVAATRS